MKTWRLISGILSIVLSLVILLQSCAVGMLEAMGADGSDSASGLLVALLLIAAGIVAIVTRNGSRGGSIALVVLYAVAAVIGFSATVYADLIVWAVWCCVCAVAALVSLLRRRKHGKDVPPDEPQISRCIRPAGSNPPAGRTFSGFLAKKC